MSDNGEIVKHCEHRNHYNANYKMTTKYQITETPEPVYYLDIPEEFRRWIKPELLERQGETNNAWSGDLHRLGWIKQKQPELTREELKKRLEVVDKELDGFSYQSAFVKNLRSIIANGWKP